MKSQILTTLFIIVIACFIQPTHQHRLRKRELTEYHLTSFIVSTCSAKKIDMFIQNLCDQTLKSALEGNFPVLVYYCKTVGVDMKYCNNINRQTVVKPNGRAKRFVYRRSVQSLNEDNNLNQQGHDIDIETDLEQKLIMENCIQKTERNSLDIYLFCNKTLKDVQRGWYPKITRFCKYHLGSDYCRHVKYNSSLYPWSLLKPSSRLSSSLSTDSILSSLNPSLMSSSVVSTSDIEPINDQQRIDNSKQQ